eukprot:364545-Chlamydomonas_euryale.AAC.4
MRSLQAATHPYGRKLGHVCVHAPMRAWHCACARCVKPAPLEPPTNPFPMRWRLKNGCGSFSAPACGYGLAPRHVACAVWPLVEPRGQPALFSNSMRTAAAAERPRAPTPGG